MDRVKIENKCRHLLQRYNNYLSIRSYDEAIRNIAEIFDLSKSLPNNTYWMEIILEKRPSDELIEKIHTNAINELIRIQHIMSVGYRFNVDEILLVLLIRHTLYLLTNLFERAYKADFPLEFLDIDQVIQDRFGRIKLSGVNSRLFHTLYFTHSTTLDSDK